MSERKSVRRGIRYETPWLGIVCGGGGGGGERGRGGGKEN